MTNHTFDMSGPEDNGDLVQRFVDQELSAEERVRFLSRLGKDEALRRRTIELEQLVLQAGRLPHPVVPDGFVTSVMERIAEVRPDVVRPDVVQTFRSAKNASTAHSPWRKWLEAFWAPRTLRWNLASAMAAAGVVALIAAGLKPGTTTGRKPGTAAANANTSISPASSGTLVRLVIMQPGAKTVQVAGDFNGWNPAQTALEQISDGAWAVTIALKPGRYAYMFVVDGKQWVLDPFAVEQKDDGFGSRNAVLDVRPAETRLGVLGASS